ncbi:Uncharacterized conserved protein UCP029407 [mine drainage metagenome]|uniref:Uncharacterized conserved protein UCP029407 n=2 Tax=mine drainage metagenome TaxID=410659 RepID=T1B9F2_9ZZZZ
MQEQHDAMHRQMILVLGMHRSGTSAVTGVFAHLGAALGGHLIPAADDNPKGFFEHADIVAMHQNLLQGLGSDWDDTAPLPDDWLTSQAARTAAAKICEILRRDFAEANPAFIKDPRICRLVPLWREVLQDEGFRLKVVLVVRDGFEVAASLVERDGLRPTEAACLWLRHELEAEAATRGDPRVVVSYTAILHDWRSEVERIAVALNLKWPRSLSDAGSEIDEFLDSGLRHHRQDAESESGEQIVQPIAGWLNVVHAALTNPAGIETKQLDEITRALSRMDRNSDFYLPSLQRLRKEVQHWRPEAEKVWKNHEWLRARVEELEAAAAGQKGNERLYARVEEIYTAITDQHATMNAVQDGIALELRQQQTAVSGQLATELEALRGEIEGSLRQVRDAVIIQQETACRLSQQLREQLDAQREMIASELTALRSDTSLTRTEFKTLRDNLLESQHKLDALRSNLRLLYSRRLNWKERLAGRLLGMANIDIGD